MRTRRSGQARPEDDAARFRVEITVPQGALSDRRKAGLVVETTTVVLDAAGLTDADAQRVWVLITNGPTARGARAGR